MAELNKDRLTTKNSLEPKPHNLSPYRRIYCCGDSKQMHWLLGLVLVVANVAICSVGLYYAWRWALENFNLGHIQLSEFDRREYEAVAESSDDP